MSADANTILFGHFVRPARRSMRYPYFSDICGSEQFLGRISSAMIHFVLVRFFLLFACQTFILSVSSSPFTGMAEIPVGRVGNRVARWYKFW
jgi:hypothetical protein